jgi:hypothetical protein
MIQTPANTSGERTDIIYGIEDVIDFTIQSLSLVRYSFDVCTDSNGPSVILSTERIKNAYYGLRKKGVNDDNGPISPEFVQHIMLSIVHDCSTDSESPVRKYPVIQS